MGTIYLVRHGQASFDSADYDKLSALGQLQAAQLGACVALWHGEMAGGTHVIGVEHLRAQAPCPALPQ